MTVTAFCKSGQGGDTGLGPLSGAAACGRVCGVAIMMSSTELLSMRLVWRLPLSVLCYQALEPGPVLMPEHAVLWRVVHVPDT
jgi:hypothetical protein